MIISGEEQCIAAVVIGPASTRPFPGKGEISIYIVFDEGDISFLQYIQLFPYIRCFVSYCNEYPLTAYSATVSIVGTVVEEKKGTVAKVVHCDHKETTHLILVLEAHRRYSELSSG